MEMLIVLVIAMLLVFGIDTVQKRRQFLARQSEELENA
jgi:competence protein ComGC